MFTKALLASALVLGTTLSASAVTIDFESLEQNNNLVNDVGSTYSESGFTFAIGPNENYLGVFGTAESRYTGSTALFNDTINGTTTLTQDSGDTFGISGITISELSGSSVADVTFDALLGSGSIISQTFTLDGIFGNEVFTFGAGFTDIVSLSWIQQSPFHQFDDVVLTAGDNPSPVPLPASGLLLIAAFGGMAAMRKRSAA